MQDDGLGRVEGPAVEARKPTHVGRILADYEIESRLLHAPLDVEHPALELCRLKGFLKTHCAI